MLRLELLHGIFSPILSVLLLLCVETATAQTFPVSSVEAANNCANYIVNSNYKPGNILRYGTNSVPGSTVMTQALQYAITCNTLHTTIAGTNSTGHNTYTDIYIPAGHYIIGEVDIPDAYFFDLHGDGFSTVLEMQSGSGSMINWTRTSCCLVTRSRIHDMTLDGDNNSSGDLIHLEGVSAVKLERLMLDELPTGHDGIYINGAAGVPMHEALIEDIYLYTSLHTANAGIEFGPLAADSDVGTFVMEDENSTVSYCVSYCIEADNGAVSTSVHDSHLSNCATNIIYGAGGNNFWSFSNDIFDYSRSDNMNWQGSYATRMTNVRFFNIGNALSGLKINNATNFHGTNLEFNITPGATAAATVTESGASDENEFNQISVRPDGGGALASLASLVGLHTAWRTSGTDWILSGVSQSQAAGTVKYVGNGAGSVNDTQVEASASRNGIIRQLTAEVDSAPGGGESFTVTVYDNGNRVCTGAITGASYQVVSGCFYAVTAGDSLYTQVMSSAGAATSNVRVTVTINQ